MNNQSPSITALATSLIRAHHTRVSAELIHTDPWGDLLVPDSYKLQFVRWYEEDNKLEPASSGAETLDSYIAQLSSYASVVLRARYTEEALAGHLRTGTRQYVLVGAGFDSYSLRRPAAPVDLAVFEIDHPATQKLKIERINQLLANPPDRTQYVAADLSQDTLSVALRRSDFSSDAPALFSWLGVTVYLSREDNLKMLRAVAALAAPGSAVVFTYTDQAFIDTPGLSPTFERMAKHAASMGEPFLSGFAPLELPALLGSVGLQVLEDLDGQALGERYSEALRAPAYSHIVHATISSKEVQAGQPRGVDA
jgi:methyltransferase (TIGR00027 family)